MFECSVQMTNALAGEVDSFVFAVELLDDGGFWFEEHNFYPPQEVLGDFSVVLEEVDLLHDRAVLDHQNFVFKTR